MSTTFEQARAIFGSDEQMARALFELVEIMRIDLELQRALRRRAEDRLQTCLAKPKTRTDGGMKE